jgi:hypothetical protein
VRTAAAAQGALRYWVAELEFRNVDLRQDSFSERALAPETLDRIRQWNILSTISPHMNQLDIPVYLFGEWTREAPSAAWVEDVLARAVARAGLPPCVHDELVMRRPLVSPGPRMLPPDGLDDERLNNVGDDTIEVLLELHCAWEPEDLAGVVFEGEGLSWRAIVERGGRVTAHAVLSSVPEHALREVAFVRVSDGQPFDPLKRVALPEDDDERTWAMSFDETVVPFSAPEALEPLEGEDGEIPEVRLMPLALPDVRVVHGLLTDVEDLPWAPDASEVARALMRHLTERFGTRPRPTFYNKSGEADGAVDRIEAFGRQGYAFAIGMSDDEMQQPHPHGLRFRENEMLLAVADLVRELELAPMFHWIRNDPYIVNLWLPEE